MMESLMAEFVQAIDVYLGSARDWPENREFDVSYVKTSLCCFFSVVI